MRARNINFRQTQSERAGQRSYKNFARYFLKIHKILKGNKGGRYGKS